ncbi:MAG: helix-turn-helix domain-containing protein [Rhodomicrobium sp.]
MQKLFSTQELHPRDKFDFWHDVACKSIVDHSSRPQSRRSFQAELDHGCLADIDLILFENSPMEISHTKRHVASSNNDHLFICRQITGALSLEQNARAITLRSGDFTLLDPMMPYSGHFATDSKLLVLKVPRRSLEARVGQVREVAATAMRTEDAEHRLTSSFLNMLPEHAGQINLKAQEILYRQSLDLIALSLGKATNRTPRFSSGQALMLFNVDSAVEARLTDPNLDGNTVAAAVGISVRYANSLLVQQNTSLTRLIRSKRLARCLDALQDPLQARRTVSEIAYSWGFSDMTHFGRVFKKAYGVLPSEIRGRTASALRSPALD